MYLTNDERSAQDAELQALLTTHAAALAPLLGPLWPVRRCHIEQFGPLVKYSIGQLPDGRWVKLHHLTGPDTGAGPHDHPCRMDSYGIEGAYWERSYHPGGRTELTLRAAGGHYTVWPETVHEIVSLPQGSAWTLIFSHEVARDWRHYPELVQGEKEAK